MRELKKEVYINDETYILHRYDAMTGMKVMKFVAQKCIPLFVAFSDITGLTLDDPDKEESLASKAEDLATKEEKSLNQSRLISLSACYRKRWPLLTTRNLRALCVSVFPTHIKS